MLRLKISTLSVLIVFSALFSIGCGSPEEGTGTAMNPGAPAAFNMDDPVTAAIFQATVQITQFKQGALLAPAAVEKTGLAAHSVYAEVDVAYGLGTLVASNGEVLLITHDHWPDYRGIERPDAVQFHDRDGRLLLEMSGDIFSRHVLFRDSGTLIIQPPQELLSGALVPAPLGHIGRVAEGHLVTVVRRLPGAPSRLDLIQARVEGVDRTTGLPQIELRSLNGETIEPGDSGGGIWLEGAYVGNLWSTVRMAIISESNEAEPILAATDQSTAAGLTAEVIHLVDQLQAVQGLPPEGDTYLH